MAACASSPCPPRASLITQHIVLHTALEVEQLKSLCVNLQLCWLMSKSDLARTSMLKEIGRYAMPTD